MRSTISFSILSIAAIAISLFACDDGSAEGPDQPPLDLGGDGGTSSSGGSSSSSSSSSSGGSTSSSGSTEPTAPSADRFATKVVSFTPGKCAGFGATEMPDIVLGAPRGEGTSKGSLDVVSLGTGGEIVLSFETNAIVDGPGVDFIVFENAFFTAGDPNKPFFELAEVSVSDDGTTWTAFPCDATLTSAPYGDCAGWRPVMAASPELALDPNTSGGDPFDLATIGVSRARFVRIQDKTKQTCASPGPNNNGFDLDAIAAVNAEHP